MNYQSDENEQGEHNGHAAKGFLAGVMLGGLIGAATMVLLAPQSGKRTRAKIQRATMELRDQTVAGIEDVVAQARTTGRHLSADIHKQAEKIQQHGQDMLDEQKERWSPVVEAGQKAVQGSAKN